MNTIEGEEMDYETAYEKALEQVKTIKDFATADTFITVCGKEFRVNAVKGYPRCCSIWSHRDGKAGLSCVGTAMVQKCVSIDAARAVVASKIAQELYAPRTFGKPSGQNATGRRWHLEIMKTSAKLYCAKMVVDGQPITGLPEYVKYRDLQDGIFLKTGIRIPFEKDLIYSIKEVGKRYAIIDVTREREDCRVTEEEFRNGWKPARYNVCEEEMQRKETSA